MTDWTSGGEGALGGAATGASIGMMGGPIGAGIGAGIGGLAGGLIGLFGNGNDDQTRSMLMDYYNQVKNRQAPQLGAANQSAYSGFRANQSDLINRLDALSRGQGPSLAAQQFQQATDRNVSSQNAMANSGRGGPMAAFTAANNVAGLGAQAAQGSAIARTGEEMNAYGQLGQAIGQGRAADEATNMFNTGQSNQFQLSNLQSKLQTMGYNDQAIRGVIGQLMGLNAQPTMGQQLLAGGAGALSTMASHYGQGNGSPGGTGPQSSGADMMGAINGINSWANWNG